MTSRMPIAKTVADTVRSEILRCELSPGAPLSQTALAARFDASRIPIREALQQLRAEGLVELQPSGASVSSLSVAELEELYELRGSIEPRLTEVSIPHLGMAPLLAMQDELQIMSATENVGDWLAANARFHAHLYRNAARPMTIALVDELRAKTDRYLYLHLTEIGNVGHLAEEHEAIYAAAEAKDSAGVFSTTRQHLDTSHRMIMRYLLDDSQA